jgi:hypothetical protein
MNYTIRRPAVQGWLAVAVLAALATIAGVWALSGRAGVAGARPGPVGLATSWEDGTLHIHADGFAARERVTFAIRAADADGREATSAQMAAQAGAGGDFGLHTNLVLGPNQRVTIAAQGDQGTVASTTATVPSRAGPARPIVLLPALPQAPQGAPDRALDGAPRAFQGAPGDPAALPQLSGPGAGGMPLADVPGPGQAVPMPAAQCPQTTACQYAERTLLPDGYRLQALEVCGANCSTQYWVSDSVTGQPLISTDAIRGGGLVAIAATAAPGATPPDQAALAENHPSVRTVLPSFVAGDAACCPSAYVDTTYVWDAGRRTLVAAEPTIVPAAEFGGWDAAREQLTRDGFADAFSGL